MKKANKAAVLFMSLLLFFSFNCAALTYSDFPVYSGEAKAEINSGEPLFTASDFTVTVFEKYSSLDLLGRCGTAYANVCVATMPADSEKRGSISSVTPTGWQSLKFSSVSGGWLYNRCHLIGWQLTAENANKNNLITGTRYLNIEGMLDIENSVAEYVKTTENHVLYRVTPYFTGNDLLARGVLMEAECVVDCGKGIKYCVYCYNVQPGITINYSDGTASEEKENYTPKIYKVSEQTAQTFTVNTNTKKFHLPTCSAALKISLQNRDEIICTAAEAEEKGYSPCGICHSENAGVTETARYYGDINLDNEINAADARLALRLAVKLDSGSETQTALADVDFNGKIEAADARIILRHAVGLEKI